MSGTPSTAPPERAFHAERTLGSARDLSLLRRIWPFVRPHAGALVFSLLMLVLLAALGLVRPLVMGSVAAHAAAKDAPRLLRDGVLMTVLLVATQLVLFVQVYAMQLAGARAMADLRRAVFAFCQRLSLRYFDRTPIGRLVTRATNDVDALGELFALGAFNAIGDVLGLVGIVVTMLLLDWRMSLIAFSALPIVGVIVESIRRRSREAYRSIRTRTARLNVFLDEQVSGIAVVQAFGREAAMAEEFDEINTAYRDANKRSVFYEAVLDAVIELVSTICVASVLWWAGVDRALRHLGDERVSFSLVVTFTQYLRQAFEPISMLSQRYTLLQSAMSGAERIFELFDETDLETEDAAPSAPSATATAVGDGPTIEFDGVTFGYRPDAPVIRDVSFTAARGELIALVGATGAGKSTIGSLLLRLYEAGRGAVRVFGREVRSYRANELRTLFSVVPQDVYLFSGTVLSNVALSDASPDRARAEQALARTGALELFLRRPGGLDATVDERGANFSAGERQLLAFARALYRDAPIVLLDEATASVDSDTEARLQAALGAVLEGRTAIVIAHRLSTIRAADRIVVLHKGRVVEQGTHDQLIARGGVYARLYRMQFAHERVVGSVRSERNPASAEQHSG